MIKILDTKKLNFLQIFLLGVILYFVGIKKDYKYDELLIGLFSITIFLQKDFIERLKELRKDRELKILLSLVIINIILFIYNYYIVFKENGYIFDVRVEWLSSIILKAFYLFSLIILMKIKYKERYLMFLSIVTCIPIIKILNYGVKTGFKRRIMGMWSNPNYVGFYLGMVLLLALILAIQSKKILYKILFSLISIISFFEIIVISKSRNALLGVLISTLILLILKIKNKKKIAVYIFLFSSFIFLVLVKINSRMSTLLQWDILKKDGRIPIYLKGIEVIKETDTLFFGKGFNYFYNNKIVSNSVIKAFHNEWLELVINQGLIGVLAYGFIYFFILYMLIKRYKENNKNNLIILGILVWAYLFVLGLFDNTIGGGRVFEIAFIIFGIVLNKEFISGKLEELKDE